MDRTLTPDAVLAPSPDAFAREIDGEIVIVPLAAGVGGTAARTPATRSGGRERVRR